MFPNQTNNFVGMISIVPGSAVGLHIFVCMICRMLYRAEPEWEEPSDVREMLDASEELGTISEDAVRNCMDVTQCKISEWLHCC